MPSIFAYLKFLFWLVILPLLFLGLAVWYLRRKTLRDIGVEEQKKWKQIEDDFGQRTKLANLFHIPFFMAGMMLLLNSHDFKLQDTTRVPIGVMAILLGNALSILQSLDKFRLLRNAFPELHRNVNLICTSEITLLFYLTVIIFVVIGTQL